MVDETAEKAYSRYADELGYEREYPDDAEQDFMAGRASRDAEVAELHAQIERFAQLDGVFLDMRDRVAGYVDAPPVARFFQHAASAFEWAATSVRRTAAGEPPLDPPVPITKLREGEAVREGYRRHITACETCGASFLADVKVRVEHDYYDGIVTHTGRPLTAEAREGNN